MRIYEQRTVRLRTYVRTECDGCHETLDHQGLATTTVTIVVDSGDYLADAPWTDSYDYCGMCLNIHAPLLKAAGSRAPLVTGEALPPDAEQ